MSVLIPLSLFMSLVIFVIMFFVWTFIQSTHTSDDVGKSNTTSILTKSAKTTTTRKGTTTTKPPTTKVVTGGGSGGGKSTIPTNLLNHYPALAKYQSFFEGAAAQYGYPVGLLCSQAIQESGPSLTDSGDTVEPGSGGKIFDVGIMQIRTLGFGQGEDPRDPKTSIYKAAELMAREYRNCGSWAGALKSYNSGSCTGEATAGYADNVISRCQNPPGSSGY